MIITYEKRLKDFNFGPQARANAELLTDEELTMVENTIMEINNGHIDETELNDLFRFDFKTICEWIGTTEKEVDKRVKTKYISQGVADRMLAILQKAKEICPEIIFKIIDSGEGDVIYEGTNPKKAVMEIVDNDYVNYCQIITKEDDENFDKILEAYKNGDGDISCEHLGYSYVEAVNDDETAILVRY